MVLPNAIDESKKLKLVFIPDAEFLRIVSLIPIKDIEKFENFETKDIENFKFVDSQVLFIPDKHKPFFNAMAKSGGQV